MSPFNLEYLSVSDGFEGIPRHFQGYGIQFGRTPMLRAGSTSFWIQGFWRKTEGMYFSNFVTPDSLLFEEHDIYMYKESEIRFRIWLQPCLWIYQRNFSGVFNSRPNQNNRKHSPKCLQTAHWNEFSISGSDSCWIRPLLISQFRFRRSIRLITSLVILGVTLSKFLQSV